LRTTMKIFHHTLPKLPFVSSNKPRKANRTRKTSRREDKK